FDLGMLVKKVLAGL
uniref:Eumenine mastoparan-EM4 n=1 Tax=Eumenes micado TaxID=2597558 RepID=MAST4_EUMMI|nr:RecName: Full=Eumenine mastoparan-EM4; Short=EMP-EM4 [Eumenes micado]